MLLGVEVFGIEFTFVGIGAILAGLGSALTGYAAIVTAQRGGEKKDEPTAQVDSPNGK